MKKNLLIKLSIIAVVLLVLGSLTNVIGYQTVLSSNEKTINQEVDQKELLFQTIVDMVNNKEIRGIILKSQITSWKFFDSNVRFSVFKNPVLTKNQLKQMYLIGLLLSKIISKSQIHSMFEQYQPNSQGMQKEISAIIEKNIKLNAKIIQLSNSNCNCENENTTQWDFPIICLLLFPLVVACTIAALHGWTPYFLLTILGTIGKILNCSWYT
ncbi:Uncharacterised protein [uncultured archaeon]|nr:Uncharacterised protein [uncultured archaeon]